MSREHGRDTRIVARESRVGRKLASPDQWSIPIAGSGCTASIADRKIGNCQRRDLFWGRVKKLSYRYSAFLHTKVAALDRTVANINRPKSAVITAFLSSRRRCCWQRVDHSIFASLSGDSDKDESKDDRRSIAVAYTSCSAKSCACGGGLAPTGT